MNNWRLLLPLTVVCVALCGTALAQPAMPEWIEQMNAADYALLAKDLPEGMSMEGDIQAQAFAKGSTMTDADGNVEQADWAMVVLHQAIEIAVEGLQAGLTPPSVSIYIQIPETPEQALALARQKDYNWQRGPLLNPDPWETANDLQDPQIAVHGGSRIDHQRAIIWYRNVFADFRYIGQMGSSTMPVTEGRLRRVALLWFNKVSRLTPPELADLRIEPDWIKLVQDMNSEPLPFEMAADRQSVGFKVQNASTTTAAKNVHAQLFVAHPGDEQARPLGEPIHVGDLEPRQSQWTTTVWDLRGENVHNGLLYVQVYTPGVEDANPDDNIAGMQVNIYYAHNGQRAFSWFDDTYSFENFTFDDRETEAMVDGIIATIVGNLSADQNTTDILERIFFPQTYMRIREYINESAEMGAGGHCYGMSATAALYFEDALLKPVSRPVPAMTVSEASANIAIYHRAQMVPVIQGAVAGWVWADRDLSVNATRAAIVQSLRDDRQSSIIEFFGGSKGHAVLAYKIIEVEGRDAYVYVYDSNYPAATVAPPRVMPRIKLHADGSNWANPTYMGYAWAAANRISSRRPHRTISLAEVNAVVPELKKSVQDMISFMNGANRMMAVLRCPADVVFTDEQGRRTGMVGDRVINEIPDAEIRTEGEVEIYMLPSDRQYSVSITGTGAGEASFDIIRAESATKAGLISFQEIATTRGDTATGTLLPGGKMNAITTRGRTIAPLINGTYEDGRVTRQTATTPDPQPVLTPTPPSPLDALLGEWSVTRSTLDGPQPTTLSFERDGDDVVGTLDDRINAYLRLRSETGGTTYVGTWTDPQAGTVTVRAQITHHGGFTVTLGTGGDDLLLNAVRRFGGAATPPETPAPARPSIPTPAPTPPQTPGSVPNLSGDWRFNGNNHRTTLTLQHEGNRLTGNVYNVPLEKGAVLEDGTVKFIRSGVNQTYTGRFSVEPDGTWKLSGTFDCPVTRLTGLRWVATRDPRGGQAPNPKLPDRQTAPETSAPARPSIPTPAPTPPQTPGSVPNLSGEWTFKKAGVRCTLTLQHAGNRLSGMRHSYPLFEGVVLEDGTVRFATYAGKTEGKGIKWTHTGRFSVEPDGTWKLSGTVESDSKYSPGTQEGWSATRDPGGEAGNPKLPDRPTGPQTSAPARPSIPTPAPSPSQTPPPASESPLHALLGEWRVIMAMLDGPQPTTLSVQQDGDWVVGTLDDRINAYLRLRAAGNGNNYRGTWTDPQAGTVAVTAQSTSHGALIVSLVEKIGGNDLLFNALRPPGGTATGTTTPAPTPASDIPDDIGGLQVGTATEGGTTTGVADHFPRTNRVATVLKYKDQQPGSTVVAVWTRDGDEVTRRETTLGGASGWLSFSLATQSSAGLRAGRYTLTITIGDTIIGRKTFTIGGGVG